MDFETDRKDKLPRDRAYPVSASVLQEKLSNVPQKSEVSVSYSYYKPMTASRWQRTKAARLGHTRRLTSRDIIEANYFRRTPSLFISKAQMAEDWFTKSQWTLTVRSCSVNDLKVIRALLDEEGFARIEHWFTETNKHAGSYGSHTLVVAFDGEALTYQRYQRSS